MLSLLACFGCSPCKTFETTIQVYSKLGGTFLGAIKRPCLKKEVDAYSVLREFQDRIATWLCHPKMPSRYLALFADTLRLTSQDFPFVDQVDVKSSQQVLGALGKAWCIEAIWDEDPTRAKSRLESRGVQVRVSGHKLSLLHRGGEYLKELLPMEVEAFTFGDTIRDVFVNSGAETLGCIHSFPHLERLTSRLLKEVDFERLAHIKTLVHVNFGVECLHEDVGLMTSLKALSIETNDVGCIPTTIGLLTRLTMLCLMGGFTKTIPSELGNLGELTCLTIEDTRVSGSIPSELCRLTRLSTLDLSHNFHLEGSLPEEFYKLKLLSFLCLDDTPVKTKGFLDGWQYHATSNSDSYWTRQV